MFAFQKLPGDDVESILLAAQFANLIACNRTMLWVPALLIQTDQRGDNSGITPQVSLEAGSSFGWMLLQTLVALLFICAVAWLLLRVMGRYTNGLGPSKSMIEIVERVAIDQRKSLYIMKVTGRWLLVGSSETGLQLLTELDPKDAAQAAEANPRRLRIAAAGSKARGIFGEYLGSIRKTREK